MFDLKATQSALRASGADAWLFCDFRGSDKLAYEVLGLDARKHFTRRWYYLVPRTGAPRKLVHAIEAGLIDELPGSKTSYFSRATLEPALRALLKGVKTVAMQYSPLNNIPTVAFADAGTVEWVRSFGVKVVSSAGLVQRLYATIDAADFASHVRAGRHVQRIKDDAFALIFKRVAARKAITEYEVAQFILERFAAARLTCDGAIPIVGANAHAADPHFEPSSKKSTRFKKGDRVLIDLWARENTPRGIYYDITWCGFCGSTPPRDYVDTFAIAMAARDAAVALVRKRIAVKKSVKGYEVDDACRAVIDRAGLGRYFIHRTGHSIGHEVHGSGVNMDGLETRDDREILPGSLFSVEPGIYLKEIGVRTELDVYVDLKNEVHISGPIQDQLCCASC